MFHSINFVRYLIDASEEEIMHLLSACKIREAQCDESISLSQPVESKRTKEKFWVEKNVSQQLSQLLE